VDHDRAGSALRIRVLLLASVDCGGVLMREDLRLKRGQLLGAIGEKGRLLRLTDEIEKAIRRLSLEIEAIEQKQVDAAKQAILEV